jgi:hypothetical protein
VTDQEAVPEGIRVRTKYIEKTGVDPKILVIEPPWSFPNFPLSSITGGEIWHMYEETLVATGSGVAHGRRSPSPRLPLDVWCQ